MAWLGGVAFLLSLGYFVYFYAVALGRSGKTTASLIDTTASIGWNTLLFGIFATHHSVMARTGAKRWLTSHVRPELERSIYVWASSLLFFVTCFWWRDIPGRLYLLGAPVAWIGLALQAAGLVLIAKAVGSLDPLELAGVRQVREPFKPGTAGPPALELTASGPYGLIRHPIYLGWILTLFAAPNMTVNRFAFACLTTAYLIVAIPWEEESLVKSYGDPYRQYRARVRWRLIPYVY